MSNFNPKEVEKDWFPSKDKEGRTMYTHPDTVRPGGRHLAVFASDLRDDDGNLVLMGKYLIPFPSVTIEDGKLLKVGKIWLSKGQCEKLLRLMGDNVKRLFRQNAGLAIFSFIGRGIEKLLGLAKIIVPGPKMFLLDNISRVVIDVASKKALSVADHKAEDVANMVRNALLDFVSEGDSVLKELAPETDLKGLVDEAVKPFLDEIRDLFGK